MASTISLTVYLHAYMQPLVRTTLLFFQFPKQASSQCFLEKYPGKRTSQQTWFIFETTKVRTFQDDVQQTYISVIPNQIGCQNSSNNKKEK